MKKLVTISFLFAIFLKSFGQGYIIDLSETEASKSSYNLGVDSIIDVRDDQNCIGFVCRGNFDKLTPAYLKQPLKNYLEKFLVNKNMPADGSNHLIIRINKLLIFELIFPNVQKAVADLNLSFIVKKGNKYYELYQAASYVEKNGEDVTKFQDENISKAIVDCINQYEESRKSKKGDEDKYIQETELYSNPTKIKNYPISNISNYKKGIYNTFCDFRDYTPDTTTNFSVDYNLGETNSVQAVLKGQDGSKIKDAWGFSDGKINYIRLGNNFFSLNKEDNNFILYNYPPGFESNESALGTSFGVVGGLISAAFIESGKKIKYNIDLAWGFFIPCCFYEDVRVESRIIILSSRYNKPGKDLELSVNGEKYCVITKGSYCNLNFYAAINEISVSLRLPNGTNDSIKITPYPFETGLLLVLVKGDKVVIENPNSDMQNEFINDIAKGFYKKMEKINDAD